MTTPKVAGYLFAALAWILLIAAYPAASFADEAADNAALKEQMRILMQRIDDLTRQVDSLSKQQAAQAATPPAPTVAPVVPPPAPTDTK